MPSFCETGGLRFTEYNAETPAGPAYNDALTTSFYGAARHARVPATIRGPPASGSALGAPRACSRHFGAVAGTRGTAADRDSRLARGADLQRVPAVPRLLPRRRASTCEIADPREVEYRDGKLWAGDLHVTLIYKRVLISELVEPRRERTARSSEPCARARSAW